MRQAPPLALILLLLALPVAAAHADYYQSEPPRNARLPDPPTFASVTLSEGIDQSGSSLEVHDCHGEPVAHGPVVHSGHETPTMRVEFEAPLANGSYQASWKALSSVDGHITSGTWNFVVGFGEPCPQTAASEDYDPVSAVARAVMYGGYALCFGALGFALYIHRDPAPQLARTWRRALALGGALVFAGLVALFLFTLGAVGLGVEGFLATTVGREFLGRVALGAAVLATSLVALWRGLTRSLLATLGLLLLLAAAGNSLFVHSAQEGWWAIAIDWLHLVTVSVWLGGLGLFLHYIRYASRHGTYEDVMRVGHRFSNVALPCVVILGLSGLASTLLILGWPPVPSPASVLAHPYRGFLGGKVLLFGLMIVLAAVNRFIFLGQRAGPDHAEPPRTYAALHPDTQNRGRAFARAVSMEATIGVLVLVLAGFLTAISPPPSLAAEQGFVAQGAGREHNVTLLIDPAPSLGRYANVTVLVEESATGAAVEQAIRIRVRIAAVGGNETAGEAYTATPLGGGRWLVGDILFARAGAHEATVEVQTETVYRDTATVRFEVAS